jgi:uncharacterized membrane protein YoaK (UPF0700 family)
VQGIYGRMMDDVFGKGGRCRHEPCGRCELSGARPRVHANMTGNVVFLGFALAGTASLSAPRSLVALFCFFLGAIAGGRIPLAKAPRAFAAEAVLLLAAALIAVHLVAPFETTPAAIYGVIVTTALAMGIRNAAVRKLAVPDLTTTVLTLTIAGLAAYSVLAGGNNPRWRRRCASVLMMLAGAAAGGGYAATFPRSSAGTKSRCSRSTASR